MCGRYAYFYLRSQLEQILGTGPEAAGEFEFEIGANYNVGPMQEVPILTIRDGRLQLTRKVWGLVPSWAKDPAVGVKMFNARSETVREKPAYSEAFEKRRCVVPISGFYEWQSLRELKRKKPYFVSPKESPVMLLAGLWEDWGVGKGTLTTFAIMTTQARGRMAELHERSPVMLRGEDWHVWLSGKPEDAIALCEPTEPDDLRFTPVSSRVGNIGNNDSSLVERVENEAGDQLGLF